jgi:membrane peptidoglycan carboxypeptidase
MVTAVSAIANGGLLMEPQIVRAVVRNGRREPVDPKVVRRVVEPSTAATITAMLEGVVERGTAKAGKIDGFMAAGKTGTASKVVDGAYSKSDYNASFVGFVPSRRPEYTILVVIDSPKKGSYYGGAVAAPIFKRIAERLLLKTGVTPTTNPEPSVIIRADEPVPSPLPSRRAALLPASVTVGGPALMPDVRGLAAREALAVLHGAGLYVRVSGNGFVQRQTPLPGAAIESGAWGSLELERRLPTGDPLP